MTDSVTNDLVQRLKALLEPGDISLAGMIVHTPFDSRSDIEMHEATVEIGELIASEAGSPDWYIESGNDDPDFASNQHQGLRLDDDEFIWECQQLLREGTFDLVFYFRDELDLGELAAAIEQKGFDVTPVEAP